MRATPPLNLQTGDRVIEERNLPPELELSPPQTDIALPLGSSLKEISVETSDANGDTVVVSLRNPPDWVEFRDNVISGTPTATDEYEIVVVATDRVNTVEVTISVTVTEEAPPPPPAQL